MGGNEFEMFDRFDNSKVMTCTTLFNSPKSMNGWGSVASFNKNQCI